MSSNVDTPTGAPPPAPAASAGWTLIGPLRVLRERGCTVISASRHLIAVFAHEDHFSAVDNRCPHMGFPLSRGTAGASPPPLC